MPSELVDGRYLEVLIRQDHEASATAVKTAFRVAADVGIAVHTVDVDRDPGLREEFAARVPVVRSPDGAVIDEGTISRVRLLTALARMTNATTRAH